MNESELISKFYEDITPTPVVYGDRYIDRPAGTRGKTIIENLECLPEPYRSLAMSNAIPGKLNCPSFKLTTAMTFAFKWDHSPQGWHFWNKVANWGHKGYETLPEIP
jgi:hypothetical protein